MRRNLRLHGCGGRAATPAGLAGLSAGFIPWEGCPGLPQSPVPADGTLEAFPALGWRCRQHPRHRERAFREGPGTWSSIRDVPHLGARIPPCQKEFNKTHVFILGENSIKNSMCLFTEPPPPRLWKPQGGPIINKSCWDEAPILMGLVLMVLFLKAI